MPKDSGSPGLLSIEVWEHLREAQILYDGAVDIVINQSRGKFHHRPNGYSSLRVTALRIILIIEYGERISKSALSSRISKLVEAKQDTLKLSGWAKSSVQDPNIQKYIQERRVPTPDLVAAAQARYTRAFPAHEDGKALHLNYWMKPLPCGTGYEFYPVKAIQTLVEEGMHPELCQFKVEGDSLANLKLSFRTQWGFSKSARVTIFNDSKPSCSAWSMDAPGPRGRNDRSLDDRFVDFAFPPEAVDYAMGCNPATSTFVVILELQDTSLCMNMALSRICDRIAPLGKLTFWFSHYESVVAANLPGGTFTPPPAFSTPSHSSIRPLFTREALTRSPWRVAAVVDSMTPNHDMTTGSQSHSSSMGVSIPPPETRPRFSPLQSGFRSPSNVQSLGALPVRKGCVSSMPLSVPSSVTPEIREVPLQVEGQQAPGTPFAKVPHAPTERPIPIQFVPEGTTHVQGSPCDEEAHKAAPFSKSYCMLEAVVSDRLVGGGPGVSPTPIKALTRAAERATYPSRLLYTHEEAQIMTVGHIVVRRRVDEDRDPLQNPVACPVQPPEVRGPELPVDGGIGAGDSTSPLQPLVHGYPSDPAASFGGRDASSSDVVDDGVFKEHALEQAMPSHQSASLGKAWGMSSEGSLSKKFEGTHAERESMFPEIISDTEGSGPSTDNSRTGHYEDYGAERYVWSTGEDLDPAIGAGLATVDQSTPLKAYPFHDAGGLNVSAMDMFGTGSHPLTLHSGPVSAGFSYSYRPLQCLGIPAEDGTLYCHRESSSAQTLSGLISGEGRNSDPVCPDGGTSSLAFDLASYDWDTFFFGSSGFP
ncbi:hypothetical protein FA13DRAFT_1716723 [Coprinellus micaceus]|uniref:Uncharacterized protein n=1 Tax=Coprinellus micaceus TaxID=71717 RepID=A0A4Y7SI31_COPMI|nr:hypothetical protein FA13DRAFT_1716723 [Coprinellus micaceus]